VHREAARDDAIPEGADFKVVPINNISHSLFSSVDFTANDTVICSESNYAYKAYFQHLFSYSKEIKKSWCVYHPFIFAKIAVVLFYTRSDLGAFEDKIKKMSIIVTIKMSFCAGVK
jgi:tRNA uridine 5-carbamoylmethylation protein Kti12